VIDIDTQFSLQAKSGPLGPSVVRTWWQTCLFRAGMAKRSSRRPTPIRRVLIRWFCFTFLWWLLPKCH